jgi:hypothetical protein
MDATLDRLIQAVRLRVGLEAAFDRSWSQCSPSYHRTPYALEVLCREVLKIKETAKEPSRALSDDHRVGLSNPL